MPPAWARRRFVSKKIALLRGLAIAIALSVLLWLFIIFGLGAL